MVIGHLTQSLYCWRLTNPPIAKGSQSDGTVLIDETKLQGMAEHKVFHLSHTSMIYSRQVINYILELLV